MPRRAQFTDIIQRHEKAEAIIEAIDTGFSRKPAKPIVREVDRRSAIERILGDADAGDVVLLAGKGHEKTQTIGATVLPFDDVVEARQALRAIGGGTKP